MITGFLLQFDALEEYQGLNDEQFGRLIRAGLRFARDGEETELQTPESYLYPGLKLKIARDRANYEEKCRKNRENINKRWGNPPPAEDTTVYDRIRMYTNDTNININPNINHQNQYQNQSINHQSQDQARIRLMAEGYTEPEITRAIERAEKAQGIRDMVKYLRQSIENERSKTVKAQDYTQRDYPEPEETPEQLMSRYNEELTGGGGE